MHFSGERHDPPTPEQIAEWQLRHGPPDNEVGVGLPWSGLLGRGPDLAIALAGATAYSTGLRLGIAVRARRSRASADLFHAVSGGGSGRDRLLIGVEFADGRQATAGGRLWPPGDLPAGSISLQWGGGSGGDRTVDTDLFVHPLPPVGSVAVVCAWPGRGVSESRTEFTLTAGVADGVTLLWPLEPPDPAEPPPPEPPDVPDGGWFARVLDR